MLRRLERKFGGLALPNLTLFLVGGQLAAYVLSLAKPEFASSLMLVPAEVLEGEVWRLLTYLFTPPASGLLGPIGVLISLYVTFLFGRALESYWGDFRYNVFVLVGWLATAAVAFLVPYAAVDNVYLMTSIFLAFAYLNPDFELLLFFVLPIKVKWLARLTWVLFALGAGFGLVSGSFVTTLAIAAATLNFFLFFGRDISLRLRGRTRRAAKAQRVQAEATQPTHVCAVCGLTDKDAPDMAFRYCSKCAGSHAYCKDHLRDHEHVVE
jgi:hypothetical protein